MSWRLTPDGVRYLAMANGRPEPMPFGLRALMPMICGNNVANWIKATIVSEIVTIAMIVALALQMGATLAQGVFAASLFVFLPWVKFCRDCPVLVDMPGMALSLLAAVVWSANYPAIAIAIVLIAALASEKAPVWAALFAWSPFLLVGLVVPLLMKLLKPTVHVDRRSVNAETLTHPFRTGIKWHRKTWYDPRVMLFPWGACLVAAFNPSLQLGVVLVVAYAQLFVATDTVRLYQHAAPIVCIAAATAFPFTLPMCAAMMIAMIFNPWGGSRA